MRAWARATWRDLAAAGVASASLVATVVHTTSIDAPAGPTLDSAESGPRIVLAHGSDRYPSDTAEDWVTYADHVVVARAASEVENPPDRSEVELGEGIVGRNVQMVVQQVLWSAPDAPQAAPTSWDRTSMGWHFRESVSSRTRMGIRNASRVEVGHTYVLAIQWAHNPCQPGEGEWLGLGTGSTIPYDDGVLGVGEFEGEVFGLADTPLRDEVAQSGLRHALAGSPARVLTTELRAAVAIPAQAQYQEASDIATCQE